MSGSLKWFLMLAVLAAGVVAFAPQPSRAAKWSVHVHGHFPAYHAGYVYRHHYPWGYHRPWGHYWHPPAYYHHPVPPVVHVYPAPVIVRAPRVHFYYGPVRAPRPMVHYRVW